MKDMMISDEEKKDSKEYSVMSDGPKYPYGLKIHFDHECMKRLELEDVPTVGDKFMVLGYAEVCDVHQDKYEGDEPKYSMGLQLMKVDLKKKDQEEERDMAKEIYGSKE